MLEYCRIFRISFEVLVLGFIDFGVGVCVLESGMVGRCIVEVFTIWR